jgi:hypothetical protein
MTIPAPAALCAALLAAASLLPRPAAAAEPALLGTLTLLDGDALVIREALKFPAPEGLRLQSHDIVHTAAGTRLARMEFSDGTVLDLGPGTRLLLRAQHGGSLAGPPAAGARAGRQRVEQIYLSQGWVKLATPKAGPSALLGFAAPLLDLQRLAGTAVVQAAPDGALLFVETGSADVLAPRGSKTARSHKLAAGQAFSARAGEAAVQARPPAALAKGMPRAFADSLPARAARFTGVEVKLPPATDISYDDVAGWINSSERGLRTVFRERWAARAEDPAFRARLVAEIDAHPEWDRLLFPHKYAPPQAGTPPPHAVPQAGGASRPLPYHAPASPPAADTDRSPAETLPVATAR